MAAFTKGKGHMVVKPKTLGYGGFAKKSTSVGKIVHLPKGSSHPYKWVIRMKGYPDDFYPTRAEARKYLKKRKERLANPNQI